MTNRSPLPGVGEETIEEDSHSAISLDVDRTPGGDSSSTSSRLVSPHLRILRGLSRKLHVITSTISKQDTEISMGSSNVFRRSKTAPRRVSLEKGNSTFSMNTSAGTSQGRQATTPSSNDRSTPSLWYENITTPLKASKNMFRGMFADLQDKTSSTFGGCTPRTARFCSDADDLNLNEHLYGGRGMSMESRVVGLPSYPVEDIEDETFQEAEGEVFGNRNATPARQSDRISRENCTQPAETIAKSQSAGNISDFGFDPKIKFNNFVLDSSL